MWSKELMELSRKHFEEGFCPVKSWNDEFGELVNEYGKSYHIFVYDGNQELTFNSIENILNAGWVVD